MLQEVYIKLMDLKLSILEQMFKNDAAFKDSPQPLKVLNDVLKDSLKKVNEVFNYIELALVIVGGIK
nr:MAG: hypothetical protein [Microvirus Sku218]